MNSNEESVFAQAIERENSQDRLAFLDQACANQPQLRAQIELLLAAYPKGEFLESPAGGNIATLDSPTILEPPGSQIGRYKLLEKIGEGGMGLVYMAEQSEPVRRRVALKIIKPGMDSRQVIARFEAERQALALMDHPNIAKIHDAGTTENGRPFFVMELVRGIPVTEYCDKVRLPPRGRLELFVTVCQAVVHAHQKGIIHRDLKPSNVLVTLHDGTPVAKVIDFGIAKAISQQLTEKTLFTAFAQMVGTPLYMSPEQAEMSGLDVDTRSDVYSLGVLLYELLTGQTPFDKERLANSGLDEIRRIIREDEPLRPSQRVSTLGAQVLSTLSQQRGLDERRLAHSLRGELDWIVMKALEKDRTRRYESASAFAADVERYLNDEPVAACPPTAVYRLSKFARRNRVAIITGLLVSASLVLGLVASSWQAVRAGRAEVLANQRLQEVSAEKERADEERAIAVAVNEFLQNELLGQAAPDQNARAKQVTVEEVLGRAATQIAGKFGSQPRIEATLRKTIGDAYSALGNYPAAQVQLESALEIRRRILGDEHSDTVSSMNNLALVYLELSQYDKAEPLIAKALEISRRTLGEEHQKTLASMTNQALLYHQRGQYAQAEPLYVQIVEISRRVRGEADSDTLIAMNNLATLYESRGQYAQAETLHVETLAASRSALGEEHPRTLLSMNNLAAVYQARRQFSQAEPLFVKALDIKRRVLGEEHPDTLTTAHNLAVLYWEQGQFEKAEPLCIKTLDLLRRVLGEEHPTTLSSVALRAMQYQQRNQYAQAETLHVQTLEARQRVLGDEHPETVDSMRRLAMLYQAQSESEKAEPLFVKALEISRRIRGEDHPYTLGQMYQLGAFYREQVQYEKAEPLYDKLLEVERRVLGNEHPDTLTSMSNLALLYDRRRKYAQAEPLCIQALEGRRRVLGEEHPATLQSMNNLAGLYSTQGQYAKAEPIYVKTLELSRRVLGDKNPETLNLMNSLASLYENQGQLAQANLLARELVVLQREQAGVDSLEYAGALVLLGRNLLSQDEYAEAEAIVRGCLAIRERKDPDRWTTFNARSLLGGALLAQEKYAEAEPLLVSGYQGLKVRQAKLPSEGERFLTDALERLVQLYDAWGRPDQAATWREVQAAPRQAEQEHDQLEH